MSLSQAQLDAYREQGHLTVAGVFSEQELAEAHADIDSWGRQVLERMTAEERAWYLERGIAGQDVLRKLDNPVFERAVFRRLAESLTLTRMVEQLIGGPLVVRFSQVFLKPAGGGGPKPVHQDNYYFGTSDPDGMVTAWIALDDADEGNGCLYYAKGSNRGAVLPHVAPAGQPYDLQVEPDTAAIFAMSPAPVPRGGVSFHHGSTLHQSSDNRSERRRRACAMHYVNARTTFANPALTYDASKSVAIG